MSSAKQNVYLPGWPSDVPSMPPVLAPSTFIAVRRTALPMVAFARLPGPRALCFEFMSISWAIGPLTTRQSEAPPVEVTAV